MPARLAPATTPPGLKTGFSLRAPRADTDLQPFSCKGPDPIRRAPPSDLNYPLPKASFPNTVPLGVRASAQEF